MPRATEIFRMLENVSERTHIRHEFACAEFSRVRHGMRTIITSLLEDETSSEIAEGLRHLIFTWLTTPVSFSEFDGSLIEQLGTPSSVGGLWGGDMMLAFVSTREALSELQSMTSPLRAAVEETLVDRIGSGQRIRVFCHRTARAAFTSMYAWEEHETSGQVGFLHTPRDYRIAEPFDVLIRVGPLRRIGFAGLTGAVVNAPRYHSLLQFTWSGLADDEDFGQDPLLRALDRTGEQKDHALQGGSSAPRWTRRQVQTGKEHPTYTLSTESVDELTLFARSAPRSDSRDAVLIQIGRDLGVLYPPGAEVIALRRGPSGAMHAEQTAISTLIGGANFLAWPDLGDVDLGGAHAVDGRYSATWKSRLAEYLDSRPTWLESELRRKGLALRGLTNCLENWAKPASSVIHAPQQRGHFEILARVLGIEDDPVAYPRPAQVPWWRLAWAEIARSRGHAVQVGMQEQEIIQGELLAALNSLPEAVTQLAESGNTFVLSLAPVGLEGSVTLYRIEAVESGYRTPESMLRTVVPLSRAYEWRV